jgi:UDP-N-acetylmuramoyl-L-alanyl-D-glutamate--2,6-diaminopimelate ligase
MLETILRNIERYVPRKLYRFCQPFYHLLLAVLGTILYRKPSRHIHVIGVTGTKGKSSTVEFVNAVLEAAHKKTAILSTIRFKVGTDTRANMYKMTMPGRFFVQKFLHDAVKAKCEYAIIEMTSEGAKFFRHIGIEMDALIFTNLSPEHIESHGSFEKYKDAKLHLVKHLAKSKKSHRVVVANKDNPHGVSFLIHDVEKNIAYSLKDISILSETAHSSIISYKGVTIMIPLPGTFTILNALSSIKLGEELGLSLEVIKDGIESLSIIRGRVERVDMGQNFTVIVDYAHTDDSLRKLYEAFQNSRKIAVLGATGGGRDTWKRPVLGEIADTYCDEVIITNEDPYDEDPSVIIQSVAKGVTKHTPIIIEDRREAIQKAFTLARPGDTVFITGKGTDPYIMGAHGKKEPWDDVRVAREELEKILKKSVG